MNKKNKSDFQLRLNKKVKSFFSLRFKMSQLIFLTASSLSSAQVKFKSKPMSEVRFSLTVPPSQWANQLPWSSSMPVILDSPLLVVLLLLLRC